MGFLDIDNATKSYGSVEVLHKVDISVQEGEFLVLVGPSGCGKSTLLNMIAGLEEITSGEIRIKDQVMNGVHPSNRNIAMVFQSYALYPNMTVGQNITFGLEMHGVPKPERDKAMQEVAKLLQIEQLLDRKPGQLSGGQRQRVAMGRALVRNPDVFLFDEPLSNLDAKLRVDMRTEIKKLHQATQASIVYVTHDQIEAMTLATKIVVLKDGIAQQIGAPAEIYKTPANTFVADFMGSPAMNLIPATMSENQIKFSDALVLQSEHALPAGDYILGLRPEAIKYDDSHPMLQLEAKMVEHSGADCFVSFDLGDKRITARFEGSLSIEVGQQVPVSFALKALCYFDPKTGDRVSTD